MTINIAIIGGGITGLSSAFYLQKAINDNHLNMNMMLFERNDRLGGKIKTTYKDGNVIELGPDSLIVTKQSAKELATHIGFTDEIVYNNQGKTYILHRGKLHHVPTGAMMGIPTEILPFVRTPLLSVYGKSRAMGDFILPRIIKKEDISLGFFFRKRFGNEVVDRLIDPLLSGMYSGKIDELSLRATFPQFAMLEKEYRSIILGLKKTRKKRNVKASKSEQKQRRMFFSFKDGLSSFVTKIVSELCPNTVMKNAKLIHLEKRDGKYHLQFNNGTKYEADVVVLAIPHYEAYHLLQKYSFLHYLNEMPSYSKATVVLAYDKNAIKKDIEGSGFIVANKKEYTLSACTWTHKKWEHAAKKDVALLRAYVGGAYDHETIERTDEEIVELVVNELHTLMKIEGKPKFYIVKRWQNSFPQYTVGHVEKMNEIYKRMEKELPGIYLAGASYDGVGVPDCIQSGKKTAEKILSKYS